MTLANPFTHDHRVYNEAKSLVDAGHEVTVLAWDKTGQHPAIETKDDINVVRSYNTRLMDIMLYDIFRLHLWWNKGYRDALEFFEESPFDAVHCHDLSSLPIGVKLKKKLGLSLVYDAHEIWGYMVSKNVPWWRYYLWKEKRLLRHVNHMVVTNKARKNFYWQWADCTITVIDNYKHIFTREYIEPPNHGKKQLSILYIGGFLETRFLLELIDVVKELKDVVLNIGGQGRLYSAIEKKANQTKNVNFLGIVPPEKVIPMTIKNDVVFCMIAPYDKNDITASTNKQFEAMVCGRPIICTKDIYSGELTKKENIGLAIPYTKNDLKQAIIKLRDSPKLREELGRNALNAAIRKYNWEKQEEKLIKVYEEIKR